MLQPVWQRRREWVGFGGEVDEPRARDVKARSEFGAVRVGQLWGEHGSYLGGVKLLEFQQLLDGGGDAVQVAGCQVRIAVDLEPTLSISVLEIRCQRLAVLRVVVKDEPAEAVCVAGPAQNDSRARFAEPIQRVAVVDAVVFDFGSHG